MGLFNRNKYDKIKRTDVVDAITELEKAQQKELQDIEDRNKEIDKYMLQGRKSRDRNLQLALAKRINMLKAENTNSAKRIQYLNGNIQALNQLKTALDDKEFLVNNSKLPLNKLFSDTNSLKKFLTSVNAKKMKQETNLGNVLEVFEDNEQDRVEDERIYGVNQNDDNLLAMFEEQNEFDDSSMFESESAVSANKTGLEDK